ncbi:tetratricopeptide repeat protein [Sorangium sp. So ce327]|uniref:CHAT domain-containing tetratricopeptide repeat protein n=1 Tax=Sorangium sp. So ce327 TaxID=3133301 RepID=UPI003F5E902F
MRIDEPLNAHEAFLEVRASGEMASGSTEQPRFSVALGDDLGQDAGGACILDLGRKLRTGETWAGFLEAYLACDVRHDTLAAFGRDLLGWLVRTSGLADAWAGIRGSAGRQPILLHVELGDGTEPFARLPLELLHDEEGFIFARPGAGLLRSLRKTSARPFEFAPAPRVLLAWACPVAPGLHAFDPQPHVDALKAALGEDGVTELPRASVEAIEAALRGAHGRNCPFDYLHLVAHGYRDDLTGGVCLHGPSGALCFVPADRLASALRGVGLRFAFLCSCQSAVTGEQPGDAFGGVAQRLLADTGGDLPMVVATQANLPVRDSATLAERFYRHLGARGRPAEALALARYEAAKGGRHWSVPILLARPRLRGSGSAADARDAAPVPSRYSLYQARSALEEEGLLALKEQRLVSVVGLPGIGKTELGRELARRALSERLVARVIYTEAHLGLGVAGLRLRLGATLGLKEAPVDDLAVAAALRGDRRSVLVVVDNVEDLMRDDASHAAFRAQLDILLEHAPSLRVLLTTRWRVAGTRQPERSVHVPPMSREQTERLLVAELTAHGAMQARWPGTAEWARLLEVIDGHPRSLRLIARQFTVRGKELAHIVKRLNELRESAVAEPDLLGRKQAFDALEEAQRERLRSLIATMDLSFEALKAQHPEAVEAFVALSFFPGGLPYRVAYEVAGGDASLSLEHLLRLNLIEWHDERTFYPVPIHWYAERRRKERQVDEAPIYRAALAAFAEFVEERHGRIASGEVDCVWQVVAEEGTLRELARWARAHGEPGLDRSAMARIAAGADGALGFATRNEIRDDLLRAGLECARAHQDRAGEANCLQSLGDLLRRVDDLEGARKAYDGALPIYREIRERLGEANCLRSLGDLLMRVDDLEGARKAYDGALPIYREIRARLGEANCLRSLGDLLMRVDDLEGARKAYDGALPIYREIRARLGEANCLKSLGDLLKRVDDLEGARKAYDGALPIYREIRERLGEANCLKSLGDLLMRVDDLEGARKAYDGALPIYREIRARLGEANCLKSLGDLLMRVDDLEGARKAYDGALPIYREIRERLGEANCLRSLGDLLMRVDDLEGARKAYDGALPIYREIRERLGEANCLQSLGDLLMRVDDLEGARKAYDGALPIYREIRARLGEANCLKSLGDLLMRVDDLEGARKAYDGALPIYREIRARLGEANCLKSLGDLLMRVDDLEGARKAYDGALPIYREIRARLGEANCLKSLGDLLMRVDDLEGARKAYDGALPIYREIRARLGEANCLQSLGLLDLVSGAPSLAFQRFLEVLRAFQNHTHQLGQQSAHGYLARAAAMAGALDQALLLAEASLALGRRIQDRFGQRITLSFQMALFQQLNDVSGLLATTILLRDLHTILGEQAEAQQCSAFLEEVQKACPQEFWVSVLQDPESVRKHSIAAARDRFTGVGRGMYDPPG